MLRTLQNLELKHCSFAARQAADDTIDIFLITERERHLRGFGLQVDQRIVPLARLPEECPRDGVQQRGFARSIRSRDAGQVEGGEVYFDRVTVGEKAREFQVDWDHETILSLLLADGVWLMADGIWLSIIRLCHRLPAICNPKSAIYNPMVS